MRLACIIVFASFAGCDTSETAFSPIRIPGSRYSIALHSSADGYCYTVDSPGHAGRKRPLGWSIQIDESVPAEITELGGGVSRIQWGRQPNAAYVIVDAKLQAVIEDSSPKELIDAPDPLLYPDLRFEEE